MRSESIVFKVLDGLHHTAEGADGLPAWYLCLAAPGFSGILAHLINMSVDGAFVPTQWKTAVIRPKAKVAAPKTPPDFRPILVLPILSRVVERFIVQRFIYPSLDDLSLPRSLKDQFAFRPTGSTTAAAIAVLDNLTEMMAENELVLIISTDYTKEFDSIRHDAVADALLSLDMPDAIYNWLVEYLEDRRHHTSFEGCNSIYCGHHQRQCCPGIGDCPSKVHRHHS